MSDTKFILLIDDSPEDYEAIVRALAAAGSRHPVYRFSHAEDALDFLRQRGRYFRPKLTEPPGLVLLDLNLPTIDGLKVLSLIRADAALRCVPVVIYTGCASETKRNQCLAAGADGYIIKPCTIDGLKDVGSALCDQWLNERVAAGAEPLPS
jgi:two-component system response regulator